MTLPIYTFDVETDPFKHGRVPVPFAAGLYDGSEYWQFWGDNCISECMTKLENLPPGIVYAHNGGRFDFFFIMPWILGSEMRIINSRIISAKMQGVYGEHELRDSFAIMPFALGKMKVGNGEDKKEIDIKKLEKKIREKHKVEILEYLKMDCVSLYNLTSKFQETFGSKTLTIGTAAMRELKMVHSFENLESDDDVDIRGGVDSEGVYHPGFYYGGRVECFESGIIKGDFKVYDVNSMYPYAMKTMKHPIGRATHESTEIEDSTMFLTVTGKNKGAFPSIIKGKIMFDVPYGTFHVTRHEYDAAIDNGLFDVERIERCVNYEGRIATFEQFVSKFYNLRIESRLVGDEIMALFYKFILNSAYGKFGQNPENYKEYTITEARTDLRSDGWEMETLEHGDAYIVWSKPTKDTSRYNVATGASITGAARSILLRGIATAKRPLYCDTDSIICSDLPLRSDPKELGAWKVEARFNEAAIGGRKLYALFETRKKMIDKLRGESEDKKKFNKKMLYDGSVCVKQANKGVAVTPIDIWNVCNGHEVMSYRDAPSFKLDGSYKFISRKVRMTANM